MKSLSTIRNEGKVIHNLRNGKIYLITKKSSYRYHISEGGHKRIRKINKKQEQALIDLDKKIKQLLKD